MENKMKIILPKKDVLAITEIKDAGDMFQILNCIRVNGRKDDKVTEKLVCLLIRKAEWKHGHGMELYELILRQYSDEEMLNQLLAVSGISDGYWNLDTAAKRRKKYADNHLEILIGLDAMDKNEKVALRRISKDVYCDFVDNRSRLLSLYNEWISQMGFDPKILGALNIPKKSEEPDSRKTQMKTRTTASGHKKTKGRQKNKKGSWGKTRIPINIITLIKVSFGKVTNESPQHGLEILVCIVGILGLIFLTSNRSGSLRGSQIEDISVIYPNLELVAGEKKDPGIEVSPAEADKDSLRCIIKDPSIADVTQEWKVIGGDGWQEGADNTTTITLKGGHAKDVEIFITLKPRFIDKADEEVPTDGGTGEWQDW